MTALDKAGLVAGKAPAMTDAATIAKGLTKAQREALLAASFRPEKGAYWPEGVYLRADKRVRWNLVRAGLILDYLAHLNRLTPLGLSVRAILAQETDR